MPQNKFYLSSPIYYVNDNPHIGHSYTQIACDTLALYHKLSGDDVFFLTGTDEHGSKIEKSAAEKGLTPAELVDKVVLRFTALWEKMGVDYSHFIRTTSPEHIKRVQKFFQKLYEKGDIYLGKYSGWYCVPCETFFTEFQVKDSKLCPDCRRELEKLEEESYFFKLSKYVPLLLEHIKNNPQFIQPQNRKNEVVSLLKQGVEDLSVTRLNLNWGIELSFNKQHKVYVWFDALLNYITGLNWPDGENYKKYWPCDVHIVGKDILKFHSVIWPAMLMAAEEPLPRMVYAHGWWTVDGQKMSKSLGNVINPAEMIEKYSNDIYRYFLLREISFGADGDFSEKSLKHKVNSELANDYGNLLNRTIGMVYKYYDGVIPQGRLDARIEEDFSALKNKTEDCFKFLKFNDYLFSSIEFVKNLNKFISDEKPWELFKEEKKEKLDNVIYSVLEGLRLVSVLLHPVLKDTTLQVFDALNYKFNKNFEKDLVLNSLSSGGKLKKTPPLFKKYD